MRAVQGMGAAMLEERPFVVAEGRWGQKEEEREMLPCCPKSLQKGESLLSYINILNTQLPHPLSCLQATLLLRDVWRGVSARSTQPPEGKGLTRNVVSRGCVCDVWAEQTW